MKRTAENAFNPEVRKTYLGGTDAAAICGMSDYKTAFDVWLEKTVGTEPDTDENKADILAWGHRLEPVIADAYAEKTGDLILAANVFYEDKEHPFICANTDRIMQSKTDGSEYILECKTVASTAFKNWSNGVPLAYYTQAQWYLGVTGLSRLVFAILVMDSRKMETFEVIRDDTFIAEIRGICTDFWNNCVVAGNAPDLDSSDYAKVEVHPESAAHADIAEVALHGEIKNLKDQIKQLEKQLETKINEVKSRMGTNAIMCLPDGTNTLFTWKSSTRETLDTKRLKEEMPVIYNQYKKVSTSRLFLIK